MKKKYDGNKKEMAWDTFCEYYNAKPSPLIFMLYLNTFKSLTQDAFIDLLMKAMQTIKPYGNKLPSIPELKDIAGMGETTAADQAHMAALKIVEVVGRIGPYDSIVFADQVMNAVIESYGGWPKLCNHPDLTVEREKWFIKDFEKTYRAFASAGRKREEPLPGITAIENKRRGYTDKAPLCRVGFKKKERRLLT